MGVEETGEERDDQLTSNDDEELDSVRDRAHQETGEADR